MCISTLHCIFYIILNACNLKIFGKLHFKSHFKFFSEPVTIQNEEKSKPDLDEGMSKSIPNKENTSEPTQNKENASEATQNKENTPTTTLKPQNRSTQHDNYASQPIRQSPRLAAIAKVRNS